MTRRVFSKFTEEYLDEVCRVARAINIDDVERIADLLVEVRRAHGRLFILGVGGSAANASHAANDFRKICGIEAYAPTDNVAELTARTNDEGWHTVFSEWLRVSCLNEKDLVMVLSVGGGSDKVSQNLVFAVDYARSVRAKIAGIVSRDGGHTAKYADACLVIPIVNPQHVTPHAEGFQMVVLHLLVSHPFQSSPTP